MRAPAKRARVSQCHPGASMPVTSAIRVPASRAPLGHRMHCQDSQTWKNRRRKVWRTRGRCRAWSAKMRGAGGPTSELESSHSSSLYAGEAPAVAVPWTTHADPTTNQSTDPFRTAPRNEELSTREHLHHGASKPYTPTLEAQTQTRSVRHWRCGTHAGERKREGPA